MSITYYGASKFKRLLPPMEQVQQIRELLSVTNSINLAGAGLNYTLWTPANSWMIHEVLFKFSAVIAKDYSINKIIGRGIISNLNDLLWIRCDGYTYQPVYLTQGFYTGTTLCTEIKAQLDTNPAFIAAGITPFTVTYLNGDFTITTGAGNIQFVNLNTNQGVNRNSTAGSVIGFNADTAFANSIVSDTKVWCLGDTFAIASDTADTTQELIINVDLLSPFFDVDEAMNLTVSTVATVADYKIKYEKYF